MLPEVPTGPDFEALHARLKTLTDSLFAKLEPQRDAVLIPNTEILSGPERVNQNHFYRLTEGNVAAGLGNRVLFYYEPGDLIGFDACFGAGFLSAGLDFAVRADIYSRETFLAALGNTPALLKLTLEILSAEKALLHSMLAAAAAASRRPSFQLKVYPEGAVIIEQGSMDKEVYSMISGRADVLVDGRKVGGIRDNEIFGEMSRLTGQPRSATVQAATDCEVMVFGGDDFTTLAEMNPVALLDIARNLSGRLAILNREVARPGS